MRNSAWERRKFRRFGRYAFPSTSESGRAHTALVNVSEGGLCVWLPDASMAAAHAPLLVCLHSKGTNQSLRARLVWTRPCARDAANGNEATPAGWLAGLAFVSGDLALSPAAVSSDEVEVDLLSDTAGHPDNPAAAETVGILHLDRNAVSGLHAVAENLLPVLAKHFVDIRLVLTRDRLEISAPFRPLGAPNSEVARRENQRPQVTLAPTTVEIGRHSSPIQPTSGWLQNRGVIIAACVTLVGVMAGLKLLGAALDKKDRWATARGLAMQAPAPAAWAPDLDPASARGWLDIQRSFGLTDADVRSSIRILKANDRYFAGHSLHDLTKYPAQVRRAFAMLAGLGRENAVDLGALKSDLGARLASGARFPDEPPGSRYYSNLDPGLLNNTVTLTIIELLHRRQQDPGVQHILAALAGVRRAETGPVPVVMRAVP